MKHDTCNHSNGFAVLGTMANDSTTDKSTFGGDAMKLDLYECNRCKEKIQVESGTSPYTVESVDGRYVNAEKETMHLCDDCVLVILYAMDTKEKTRKQYDKLTSKMLKEDEEVV